MSPLLVLLWVVVGAVGIVAAVVVVLVVVIAALTIRDQLANRRRDQAAIDAFVAQLDAGRQS